MGIRKLAYFCYFIYRDGELFLLDVNPFKITLRHCENKEMKDNQESCFIVLPSSISNIVILLHILH